ncbi:MAG: hypothetical protein AAGG07_07030 [Planctomycetota bacterium]
MATPPDNALIILTAAANAGTGYTWRCLLEGSTPDERPYVERLPSRVGYDR